MAEKKLYPFSAQKHGHDLELVKNRAFNLAQDALVERRMGDYERLMELHDRAEKLALAVMWGCKDGRVSWLSGSDLAEAKKMVLLAGSIRSGLNEAWKYGQE